LLASHSADPIKEPLRLHPMKSIAPLEPSPTPAYVGRHKQQHKLRSTSSVSQYAPCKQLGPTNLLGDSREQQNATQIINAKHKTSLHTSVETCSVRGNSTMDHTLKTTKNLVDKLRHKLNGRQQGRAAKESPYVVSPFLSRNNNGGDYAT